MIEMEPSQQFWNPKIPRFIIIVASKTVVLIRFPGYMCAHTHIYIYICVCGHIMRCLSNVGSRVNDLLSLKTGSSWFWMAKKGRYHHFPTRIAAFTIEQFLPQTSTLFLVNMGFPHSRSPFEHAVYRKKKQRFIAWGSIEKVGYEPAIMDFLIIFPWQWDNDPFFLTSVMSCQVRQRRLLSWNPWLRGRKCLGDIERGRSGWGDSWW